MEYSEIIVRRATGMQSVTFIFVFMTFLFALSTPVSALTLPYDSTCPVVYDNDDADDMYTDEYLLSLASAGDISLKGMITSSGGWRESLFPDPVFIFQWDSAGRGGIAGKARRSGLNNFPTPVAGSGVSLVKPSSGAIDATAPVDTPGARLIIAQARNASASRPLVVVMGGPPTTLASAYLLDHSIASRVVLVSQSGGPGENELQDFNDQVDNWATYIVVHRFRCVLFGPVIDEAPVVDKSLLPQVPNTELRQWMIDKGLPHADLPGGQDHDGPGSITLLHPDYIVTAKPKSFGGIDGVGNMFLKDDPNGKILMVTQANQFLATTEWWRAVSNLNAYANNPLPPTLTPFNDLPAAIPGRIEAENFDYGGPEVAYHKLTVKTEDEYFNRYPTTFRVTDSVDFDLVSDSGGGYAIAVAQTGEWLNYTVNVVTSGVYSLDVRLASLGAGGTFHIEFGGVDQTGPLTVPDTLGWQNWQTLTISNVTLTAGPQVMRIVMDGGGVSNLVGDINYLDFSFMGVIPSNAPPAALSTWEVASGGKDAGTAYVSFNVDSTFTGYGMRESCPGILSFVGTWEADSTGAIAGSITEETDCGDVPVNLSATLRTGVSLKADETVNTVIRNRWKGIPATNSPDLSGSWLGSVKNGKLHTTVVQSYRFVAHAGLPGVFDIIDDMTSTTVGSAIVTSSNRVQAHMIIAGQDSSLVGKFNPKRNTLVLGGLNVASQHISLSLTLQ